MARYSVNNYTVDVLLADIKSGNIAIPEMQRPFVWDATQVRDLIRSIRAFRSDILSYGKIQV